MLPDEINYYCIDNFIVRPAARSFFFDPLPLFFRAHFLLPLHKNIDIFMEKKVSHIYIHIFMHIFIHIYIHI